jgi:hypothetical protein
MITVAKTGVAEARRTLSRGAAAAFRSAHMAAIWREGEVARQMLVDHLSGRKLIGKRPPKLEVTTLATRRAHGNNSAAPLNDSGELINAIVVKRVRGGTFVGVERSAVNRKGFPLARLAEIQENGATIVQRITPAMVAKLRSMGVPPPQNSDSSGGLVVIRIKPRPFLGPLGRAYKRDKNATARVGGFVQQAMSGWWR